MSLPIGIFDSGVGGLTVMRAITEKIPSESIIYFGDTARLPYGDKSPQTIIRYTSQCLDFLINCPVKMIVIACNTASAYVSEILKERFKIPVVDVVIPSAQKAVEMTTKGKIAVIGTQATIRSGCYKQAIQNLLPSAVVYSVACPLFVPLVEEKLIEHPATKLIVEEYLTGIREQDFDTIILGCTHYPLLKTVIAKYLGPAIHIVDSANCCAEKVCSVLKTMPSTGSTAHQFFVSDDSERFLKLATAFLPNTTIDVKLICAD